MNELPSYVSWVFLATTLATVGFVYFGILAAENYKSKKKALITISTIGGWMMLTGILASIGFYRDFEVMPPPFLLAVGPPNLLIVILLIKKKTRDFLLKIPITILTYLHLVRVPVEMVLWWLALYKVLPLMLTFEGINHDILSGVTAPFVAIFLVGVKRHNKIGAIIWNIVALGLLVNIVSLAIFSAPTPFQKFNFDQPMMAMFYFPYIWLPAVIVPIVFFAHLVSLVHLFSKKTFESSQNQSYRSDN